MSAARPCIAVLADIHGNLPALDAVIADARQAGATIFLVAGDLLARAPYPREVWQRLLDLNAILIRGNADQYQVDLLETSGPANSRTGPQWGVVRWTAAQIGAEGAAALKALPEQVTVTLPDTPPLRMVHGAPEGMYTGLMPEHDPAVREVFRTAGLWPNGRPLAPLAEQINSVSESLLICGHTHIPWVERCGAVQVLNPGAIGLTICGDPRARYALLRGQAQDSAAQDAAAQDGAALSAGEWQIDLRAVPYDTSVLQRDYARSDLLESGGAFARACLANALSGLNVPWYFVRSALALQAQWGEESAAWRQAEADFPWSRYGV